MTSIAGLRYVTPLFNLAQEKEVLDDVDKGLREFTKLLKENPELESVFLNPRISIQKKKDIVLKLTEGEIFIPVIRDFLCLLVDKGRERVFLFMAQEFSKLLKDSRNIVSATIQTPVALDDDYKRDLAKRFAEVTGKTVELTEELKPDLIAGVRIMLGSKMLDGSLKARLNGIRRHLKTSAAQTD